ncbi:hypothetical protein MUK42_31055 [Musa troglodytarum]|uniref:S-adenosyl-L-methionine-dependent methyltransferase superfamily protein n=1 Tax=Musa troglodytarum TaxID=320322 RepID=A0A9E7KHN7_9LILI|nr:hypothetical protein MUK42_31055 [Musa troglodytarum]
MAPTRCSRRLSVPLLFASKSRSSQILFLLIHIPVAFFLLLLAMRIWRISVYLLCATIGGRQNILMINGMDTRPYRLSWPCSCIIFDISPQSVFNVASKKLKGTGAKIGRNCNLVHVPLESIDLQAALYKKGFSGNMPSLWAIQGLPISTLTSLKGILSLVSSSTKKGSILMGELPAFLTGTEFETKEKRHQWTDKLFMSHGFRVNVVGYNEIAKNMHLDESFDDTKNIVFSAEQLRFSDAEMESWRAHLERIEEEGDEEGFEEL